MSGAASILVVARGSDPATLLPPDHGLDVTRVGPEEAAATLQDLRSRGVPVVLVIDAATVHMPSLLTEVSLKHAEVPLVVAAEDATSRGATVRGVWRPRGSEALAAAVRGAARTAVQQARVRTTLDRLNVRLRMTEGVTDEKQQHRLLLAGLYLSNILEQAGDAIFVTDRDGVVALWNRGAEALFGVPATAVMGQRIDALGDGGYGPGLLRIVRSLSPADPSRVVEFTAETASGPRDLEVSLSIVTDHGKAGIAVSGIARDMTERNALYRELREKTDALATSNRHKEEFLAVLSHELRTPLNTVLGWSRMLREMPHDVEHVQRAADMIFRNATIQWRLVADLLEYARITAGQMTLHRTLSDLVLLARSTVESIRPEIEQLGLSVRERYEGPVPVEVDRDRMTQVLTNLLTNAMKFTPSGGEVFVTVRHTDRVAELQVRDTGRGIDASFLPHLFDAFRQADASTTRSEKGLGLGLSITRRIVDLHGGSVEAHSDGPGRGATFTVRLELADETAASAAGGPRQSSAREEHDPS